MPHRVSVLALDLQIGMFVSDLDRPWIETPFIMQELMIENDAQIATLQQFCRQVTVDRSRSLGSAYAPRDNGRDIPRTPGCLPAFGQVSDAKSDDFAEICRHLRLEPVVRRYRLAPELDSANQQSLLEAELLYSAPLVDDVKKTLKGIREGFSQLQNVSLNEICGQVSEMAAAVQRNAEAMLWLARLRTTDQYSYDHAIDVSVHLMVFARFLGLPLNIIEQLGLAGMLMDIGKVDIPPEVLSKPDALTEDEYLLVQSHVASSLEMLIGRQGFAVPVLEIVASHHERADGSGYPRRLKGERICFHGELAGLVDSYCAMTRKRAYGPAISSHQAMSSLIQLRDTKFRAAVVDQYIQCMGIYPVGSLVELNSGEVGVVIQQNQIRRLKPRLLIILAPDKSIERFPITLDLMMNPRTPDGQDYCITKALPTNAYGIDPAEFYLD